MANQLTWKDITFNVGDTIRVHQTFEEGDKTRTQIFEGIVIAVRGDAGLKSFVVRKIATNNIGVEKIFPVESPTVTNIEIKKKGSVRRAKLYYLRGRKGKKATKVKGVFIKGGVSTQASEEVIVHKASTERPEKEEMPVKTKNVKAEKPEKVKKEKKGQKKLQKKEKNYQKK